VASFILLEFLERQRRGIFVAPNPVVTQAPSGAASSEYIAPDGAWEFYDVRFYKDSAPTALAIVARAFKSGAVTKTTANFVAGFILSEMRNLQPI
jgi:hypothetical protein